MESRKSFVLYTELGGQLSLLSDEAAGRLFKSIFLYLAGQQPIISDDSDLAERLVFLSVKNALDRGAAAYDKRRGQASEAGKASAAAREAKRKMLTGSTVVENSSTGLTDVENGSTDSTNVGISSTDSTISVSEHVRASGSEHVRASVSGKLSLDLVEQFFADLPNSSVFETIARDLSVQKSDLLAFLPEFRTTKKSAYKGFNDFCDHFKASYRKKLENLKQAPRPPKSRSRNQFL